MGGMSYKHCAREYSYVANIMKRIKRFQEVLKLNFKDSIGSSWVDAGRYEIANEAMGTVLTAKDWEDIIEPGMTLSMAMLLRKRNVADTTGHNCPSGDWPYNGAAGKDLERVRW